MNIQEFYKSVGGNYEAAKAIMMNDMFIERMLDKFFANNGYSDIVSAYEKKDYQAVFAGAHSLKGVAGNLALTSLYEISSVITEATRGLQPVDIDKEIEQLKEKYLFISNEYQRMK